MRSRRDPTHSNATFGAALRLACCADDRRRIQNVRPSCARSPRLHAFWCQDFRLGDRRVSVAAAPFSVDSRAPNVIAVRPESLIPDTNGAAATLAPFSAIRRRIWARCLAAITSPRATATNGWGQASWARMSPQYNVSAARRNPVKTNIARSSPIAAPAAKRCTASRRRNSKSRY